jgi:hypothetical protein
MTDYKTHLNELRKFYIEATPGQRLHVASERINNSGHGRNLLIAYVSSLEGFARCIVMHQKAHTKTYLSTIYPIYKWSDAKSLIEEYLLTRVQKDALSYFGQDIWEKIGFAVEYRNLLAHECTYLDQDIFVDLIQACDHVLRKLAKLEGLNFTLPYGDKPQAPSRT